MTSASTIPTPYEDLLRDVLANGTHKSDRTGTGTTSVFGRQIRFDLAEHFPLITTKRVHFRSIAIELLWFLRGGSNVRWLQERGVKIWDEWADEDGELGPVYGVQWRSWPASRTARGASLPTVPADSSADATTSALAGEPGAERAASRNDGDEGAVIDQIAKVVESIRTNPDSRRHIVTAWNPAEVDNMALPPCHALFQFYVADGKLSCQLYQRSADLFLGVPFNIASYALLTAMVAQQTGLGLGEFVWTGGDCHIYDNHQDQVREQLNRDPYPYPTLRFARTPESIFDYQYEDFIIDGYQHHPAIRGAVAV